MLQKRLMWIVWPAFLMAGVLEILVFAMFDPQDLQWFGAPSGWSSQAVYTLVFFAFWSITSVSGGLTLLLSLPSVEVND